MRTRVRASSSKADIPIVVLRYTTAELCERDVKAEGK